MVLLIELFYRPPVALRPIISVVVNNARLGLVGIILSKLVHVLIWLSPELLYAYSAYEDSICSVAPPPIPRPPARSRNPQSGSVRYYCTRCIHKKITGINSASKLLVSFEFNVLHLITRQITGLSHLHMGLSGLGLGARSFSGAAAHRGSFWNWPARTWLMTSSREIVCDSLRYWTCTTEQWKNFWNCFINRKVTSNILSKLKSFEAHGQLAATELHIVLKQPFKTADKHYLLVLKCVKASCSFEKLRGRIFKPTTKLIWRQFYNIINSKETPGSFISIIFELSS